MNIEIRRYRIRPETIDGHLKIDGLRICDTAENTSTALKAGTYQIGIAKCKFRARKMPCILLSTEYQTPCEECKKSGCVGINSTPHKGGDGGGPLCHQICPGNGVYKRTDGSIIVGKYICPGCLSNPKQAFDNLFDRIRKNAERGNPITLTIKDNL